MEKPALYSRILIAASDTDADRGLLQYASALLATQPGTEVFVAHVAPAAFPASQLEQRLSPFLTGTSRQQLSFHVLSGPREDSLLGFAYERSCELILLGHHKSHSGRRSLARRLAMKAPCSVWLVPNGSPPAIRRMLIPVDFSPRSADVLFEATALAQTLGLEECLALHVHFSALPPDGEEEEEIRQITENNDFWLFAAPVDLHGIDVTPLFEEGANIAHTIERVARERNVDLIVMGTRGRSRSAAILLGSETDEMMINTQLPLLAVKHFGNRMSLLQVLLDKRFRERENPKFS
jgi:nucleotide-binding universal stress UspA family protein